MNIKLLSIPVVLTGGAGGIYIGYKSLYQNEKKESIQSKLGSSLLGFDSSFDSKGTERATLVTSKTNLHPSLEQLRSSADKKTISKDQIKSGCQENSTKEFASENDSLFLSVRSYCTFNNKDKLIGTAISEDLSSGNINSNGKGFKANKRLKEKQGTLSTKMQELKTELSKNSGADDKVLKNGCETTYTEYFKDKNDQKFKDTEAYCTEVIENQ